MTNKHFAGFKKAAEQGDADAQYSLGVAYENGYGVEKNYREAVKWYEESAKQGDADAQYSLGVHYYNGTGVIQNYKKAYAMYLMAQANGNENALNFLKAETKRYEYILNQRDAKEIATQCYDSDYKNCGDLFE